MVSALLTGLTVSSLCVLTNASPSPQTRRITPSFATSRTPLEAAWLPTFRATVRLGDALLGGQGRNPRVISDLRKRKIVQTVPKDMEFPCRPPGGTTGWRSSQPPSSVHRLRPGDVDIVAALGDSLTAAHGAASYLVPQVLFENRGMSWSIGGQGTWRDFLTLPNILKEFNPKLIGYSLADSRGYMKSTWFNVGEMNAMSQDLPWQARLLVKRMRSDPRVEIDKHWKVVSILIGSNDFCSDMCYRNWKNLPIQHRQDLEEALTILKEGLPRTFVNLVSQPNLKVLIDMKGLSLLCEGIRRIACSCLYGEKFKSIRREMYKTMADYQEVEWDVARDPRFHSENFTVVVQPFTYRITWPLKTPTQSDLSLMAPDCFHFSQRGYARAANALWNNMMEPVGSKSTNWADIFQTFRCPTPERPYLATPKNSDAANELGTQ